jgi:hypothetical protein
MTNMNTIVDDYKVRINDIRASLSIDVEIAEQKKDESMELVFNAANAGLPFIEYNKEATRCLRIYLELLTIQEALQEIDL